MKKILLIIIIISIFLNFPLKVSAHDKTDCGYLHNSKYTGWDIFKTNVHCKSYDQKITVSRGDFSST